ncbi:MAG: hypothetical protein NWS26_07600, partial [Burkholderiaceae bacterium]|nr:hypothetical protein [Burkholderiaceae bacterium]
ENRRTERFREFESHLFRHIRANKRLSGAFLLPEPRPLTPVMRGAHGSVWRARESIKLATY